LKAKLLENGTGYPRIHSVRDLLKILSDVVSKNKKIIIDNILEKYIIELGMLEDAYITSRYAMREFTKREAEKLTKVAKEIMENVE
jgi:HEPN domain-containing protein